MEKFERDDEIIIPDEFDSRIDMSLKKAKRGSYYYRNKSKIGTSLVLAFVLFLGMNPDVRAYTKNVMEWFKSDKSIMELKENKFKIYDLVTEKDGYKVYMKDMYFDEETFSMKIAVEDENGNAFESDSEVFWGENSREFYFNDSIYFDKDTKIEKIEMDLGHGEVESMKIVSREKLDYGQVGEFKYNDKSFMTYREKDKELSECWSSNQSGFIKKGFYEKDVEYTYLKLNDDDANQKPSKYYIKKWTGIWEPMYNNIDEEVKTVRITKNEIDRQLGMELEDILKLNDEEFNDYGIKFNKYINYRLERNDSETNIDETRKTMERYIDCGQLFLGKSVSMKDLLTFRKETVSTKKDWEFGILDGSKIKTEHIELELD
ncbi:hypothetical protein [Oceanirhabdus seepicola]|uniref:DUF4179 domain-containing protein n=1 Tax=Oceanirhabdus seepicola TaxID=2828781 RepID=A0A9J6P494_9CLOT|nr:hypothetical protein [Oceanirhabdus seepicola]MCM1991535.1 hypothetical protein [Oceanirhabdus seepicola]